MTPSGKIIFLSLVLLGIIFLMLKTSTSIFIVGVLFLLTSFISALSASSQNFVIALLPFIFINGIVFFLVLVRGNGGISDNLFLGLSFAIFIAVFWISARFSFLRKNLPNAGRENYSKLVRNYVSTRNLIFSFLFWAAFIWYANGFALYSALGLPFYLALVVFFLITLCLTFFLLKVYPYSYFEKKFSFSAIFYSWIVGFIISETAWIMGFWPFGYLTAAFIATIIYYVITMILAEYLFSDNFERIFAFKEILFAGIIIAIIFYFTNWLPL